MTKEEFLVNRRLQFGKVQHYVDSTLYQTYVLDMTMGLVLHAESVVVLGNEYFKSNDAKRAELRDVYKQAMFAHLVGFYSLPQDGNDDMLDYYVTDVPDE